MPPAEKRTESLLYKNRLRGGSGYKKMGKSIRLAASMIINRVGGKRDYNLSYHNRGNISTAVGEYFGRAKGGKDGRIQDSPLRGAGNRRSAAGGGGSEAVSRQRPGWPLRSGGESGWRNGGWLYGRGSTPLAKPDPKIIPTPKDCFIFV